MSEIVGFCLRRKRHLLRYFLIVLSIWLVFLVCMNLSIRLGGITLKKLENNIKSPDNIFDAWYLSKGRSLLDDDDDNNNTITRTVQYSNITKNFKEILALLVGSMPKTSISEKKVLNFLESMEFGPNPDAPPFDCPGVIAGKHDAIAGAKLANLELKSKAFEEHIKKLVPSDEVVTKMVQDCNQFISKRKYITLPLSREEKAYPIAYIMTIHKDLQAFERLLRSIYHPQNIYCIHVDPKSSAEFQNSVSTITGCFDNVFIASNLTPVTYTHWSRVQADLNCMKDLLRRKDAYPWKYVINLCGQDFPIKTNLEIVRALKTLQGFNNLETFKTPPHKRTRYEYHFTLPKSPEKDHARMKKTDTKKDPPPNNVEMFSGSAYYIFKRQAIEYILRDPTIQKFFAWNEDAYSPDEHVWATIQRMFPQVPGSSPLHEKYDLNELQTISRIVKWGGLDKEVYPKCQGTFVRGICVFGCGDLAWIVSQHHIFANKFDAHYDVLVLDCLDNWIRHNAIEQSKRLFTKGYV